MTRTNKWDGESHHEPHYFTKNHAYLHAPSSVKKNGAGKSNWGTAGSEIDDLINDQQIGSVFNKERRGSNHSHHEDKFKAVQDESFRRLSEDDEIDDLN